MTTVPNGFEKAPSGPTVVWIGKPRKDGKQLVQFCFARRIRKLMTADQVTELINDEGYQVRYS